MITVTHNWLTSTSTVSMSGIELIGLDAGKTTKILNLIVRLKAESNHSLREAKGRVGTKKTNGLLIG